MTRNFTAVMVAASASLLAGLATAAPSRDEAVYHAVEARRASALELLKSIVDIDSGSGDVAGGRRVEEILAARLDSIGAQVRSVPAEAPGLPPNLVAEFHGTGKAKILIIAHIDTVFGPGTVAQRPFRIVGDHALGPGVGDEKGGVVNAVMALEILHELGFKNYATITLLLDDSEELGSPGSTGLIKTLARQNQVEFNMEPGDPPDAITVWRKGAGDISIRVTGRSAHAGMVPQNGRDAAVELVHQLAALQGKFPTAGDGTTVNLTLIKAGSRSNIIPDLAEATLDVRFRKLEDFDAILAGIKSGLVPAIVPDTATTVAADGSTYPPLTENPQIDALGARAQAIYAELHKPLALAGNGGASESAVVMSVGTPALDGLGFVGDAFHTDHEWIDLSSVTPRLYLFTRLLMETSRSPPGPP
ncbi:MAG TPA: glutamate carboxypeptidase [Steroidobacteraceae bacterium]|jgi:glutamate carboxypeptidase|nr:glutamate carboxypeptidase [Steroidobacteraceae bacterium]